MTSADCAGGVEVIALYSYEFEAQLRRKRSTSSVRR